MPDLNIGGQAVIEGVMIRSRDRIATAVRLPSGEIIVRTDPYRALSSRIRALSIPVLRGAVSFFEMLVIGIRTLNFSAEVALAHDPEAKEKKTPPDSSQPGWKLYITSALALGIGLGVFLGVPLAIATLLGIQEEALPFNLVAGAVRLVMFVAYIWGISFMPDIKRIFQYHGAEHKAIYTYEMGESLTAERAACHTRFHPRCGTSFVLIVALSAVAFYAIIDTLFQVWTGHAPGFVTRFILHTSLLPLVAGVSFELLKLSGRTRDHAVTRVLIQPGLWLQRITTREPNRDQLEVALVALTSALGTVPPVPARTTTAAS